MRICLKSLSLLFFTQRGESRSPFCLPEFASTFSRWGLLRLGSRWWIKCWLLQRSYWYIDSTRPPEIEACLTFYILISTTRHVLTNVKEATWYIHNVLLKIPDMSSAFSPRTDLGKSKGHRPTAPEEASCQVTAKKLKSKAHSLRAQVRKLKPNVEML